MYRIIIKTGRTIKTIILVRFNSKGSAFPVGIPLGACAIANAATNCNNLTMLAFFILRYYVY